MNKSILAVLFLVLGFFGGYFLHKRPINNSTASSPVSLKTENKFFDLVDTYTYDKDRGTVRVILNKPEADVIVFGYATSQETFEYGVYNYKTNEIFMNVGNSGVGSSDEPIAVIKNNQLLNLSRSEDSTLPGLMIKDFNNNPISQVTLNIDQQYKFFHEVYGYEDNDGFTMLSFQNTENFIPQTTKYKTYRLNESTYQLSEFVR